VCWKKPKVIVVGDQHAKGYAAELTENLGEKPLKS
jgi:hypothetical protein